MSISATRLVVPLIGAAPTSGSRSAAARVIRGVTSDETVSLFRLQRKASVPVQRVEQNSVSAAGLHRAISGFFDRVQTVREEAASLRRVLEQGTARNALNADQVVEAASSLVTAVNDLRAFVKENPQGLNANVLERVDVATDDLRLKTDLKNIGISIDDDGTLSLSETVLRDQIASQPIYVTQALGAASGLAIRELDSMGSIINSATVAVLGIEGRSGREPNLVLGNISLSRAEWSGQFVDLLL